MKSYAFSAYLVLVTAAAGPACSSAGLLVGRDGPGDGGSSCGANEQSCACATGAYCAAQGAMCVTPSSPCPGGSVGDGGSTSSCGANEHSCVCATGTYCAAQGAMCITPASPCPGVNVGDGSVNDAPTTETGGPVEGGPDLTDAPVADADAGQCTTSLAASGCPATYAAAQDKCHQPLYQPVFASCGGLSGVVWGGRPHSALCLYQAGTLVGAQAASDINEYCGQTSFLISGGNVPAACAYPWAANLQFADAGVVTHCPASDGGPDAATD